MSTNRRMKRSRVETFYAKQRVSVKDSEGGTYAAYGEASELKGEIWPASGKVQAETYGERLKYIRNVRIRGSYSTETDDKGLVHYILSDGTDLKENDGLCLNVPVRSDPDYRIISIKPYKPLLLEAEKII